MVSRCIYDDMLAPSADPVPVLPVPFAQRTSDELNAMLATNLSRKNDLNEQLIDYHDGKAPSGTDVEWLRASRSVVTEPYGRGHVEEDDQLAQSLCFPLIPSLPKTESSSRIG